MIAPVISTALACLGVYAQSGGPSFEVASIRPATPLGPAGLRADRTGGPGTADPGMYACRNCPVYWVLAEAYDLQPFEMAAPEWLQSARFDFLAKVPPGTTKADFRIMLQNLLADRFKLAAHREKKEMAAYELTVGRIGAGLRESMPGDPAKREESSKPVMTVTQDEAWIRSHNQPISWFVRLLTGQLQSPVIDATGLKGKYDFAVSWRFGENGSAEVPLDPYRPALIHAVRSQLGLKLEPRKGLAEVLVVDHIERSPSAN